MPRAPRRDGAGVWHHVMLQGAAKRAIFETRADRRYFLAQLARAVRRMEIELHLYALLDNHGHLLVRSLRGELSRTMQRVLLRYVRYFNRRLGRIGPLLRGRFRSKPVGTLAYRRVLVRYIHDNPVAVGLAAAPELYEWSSACQYVRTQGPVWLTRDWVESEVRAYTGTRRYDPEQLFSCFPSKVPPAIREWIERRLREQTAPDLLDVLANSSATERAPWLRANAILADGTAQIPQLVPPAYVETAAALAFNRNGGWTTKRGHHRRRAWPFAQVGLLREVSGLTMSEIALRLNVPRSTVQNRALAHAQSVEHDPEYAQRYGAVAAEAFNLFQADWTAGSDRENGRIEPGT